MASHDGSRLCFFLTRTRPLYYRWNTFLPLLWLGRDSANFMWNFFFFFSFHGQPFFFMTNEKSRKNKKILSLWVKNCRTKIHDAMYLVQIVQKIKVFMSDHIVTLSTYKSWYDWPYTLPSEFNQILWNNEMEIPKHHQNP